MGNGAAVRRRCTPTSPRRCRSRPRCAGRPRRSPSTSLTWPLGALSDRLHPARERAARAERQPAGLPAGAVAPPPVRPGPRRARAARQRRARARAAGARGGLLLQRARLAGARRLGPAGRLTTRRQPLVRPHAGADHRGLGVRRRLDVPRMRRGGRRGRRPLAPRHRPRRARTGRGRGPARRRRRRRRGPRGRARGRLPPGGAQLGRSLLGGARRRRWTRTSGRRSACWRPFASARPRRAGGVGEHLRGLRRAGVAADPRGRRRWRPPTPTPSPRRPASMLVRRVRRGLRAGDRPRAPVQPLGPGPAADLPALLAGAPGGRGPARRRRSGCGSSPATPTPGGTSPTCATSSAPTGCSATGSARRRLQREHGTVGLGRRAGGAARRAGGADRAGARRRPRARARARGDGPARRPLAADRQAPAGSPRSRSARRWPTPSPGGSPSWPGSSDQKRWDAVERGAAEDDLQRHPGDADDQRRRRPRARPRAARRAPAARRPARAACPAR